MTTPGETILEEIVAPKVREAIEAHWGEKCPDFDPECACCQAWAEFEALADVRAKLDTADALRAIASYVADVKARAEKAERELDEKTGCILTVGNGLCVYGSIEAISRTQDYVLLDSRHPVEKEDVRRSLARALQAAERALAEAVAERDALKAALEEAKSELDLISCEGITETSSAVDALSRATFFANRAAKAADATLSTLKGQAQ